MNQIDSVRIALLGAASVLLACSGGDKQPSAASGTSTSVATSTQPASGGRKIEIEMFSNEKGNYFEPKELTARQGDVLHFELKTGVHNVHFLPDSNPGKTGLPPASELLQIPDQELDIPVTLAPGSYYFQCDPHAALGMTGRLTVTK
jgi:plastocyanin